MKKYQFFFLFFCAWSNCFSIEQSFFDPSVDIELVRKAWNMKITKRANFYYSFTLNGSFFKGDRPWHLRWNLIYNALDWDNKRVLDLGCNIGLNLIFLKKYANIKNCVGVDAPDHILKLPYRNLFQINSILQEAFQVSFPLMQVDLSKEPYEELIGTKFDVVFCMSLLHWIRHVRNKERLLLFLSKFPHVIYEGHKEDGKDVQQHINLFKEKGFSQYEILNHFPNDRQRFLIHFWK